MPTLYRFQKKSIIDLLNGKHISLLPTGAGKSAVAITWAKIVCDQTSKRKVLICTPPSKRDAGDWEIEADTWATTGWREGLEAFEIISWHALRKWVDAHWDTLDEWVYIFDEQHLAKAGVSSGRGRAYLRITKQTSSWTGYTATPGDTYMDLHAYMVACGLVRNKTSFKARYVSETHYKGYPEIIGYRHEDELLAMWKKITSSPDTSTLAAELPSETHKTVVFKKPAGYDKAIKTRVAADGGWLDSTMKLAHYIRQLCFTKAKQQWIEDFLGGLGTNAVIFYTYKEEAARLEEIARKSLPKGAKIWRIDGAHHEIPTENTISKNDVVLCQWQSGGAALNLQMIHYWVAVSGQYSYSTLTQAEGRIKRIGQKYPMFFTELVTSGTIEEDIMKTLRAKKDFSEKTWAIHHLNDQ